MIQLKKKKHLNNLFDCFFIYIKWGYPGFVAYLFLELRWKLSADILIEQYVIKMYNERTASYINERTISYYIEIHAFLKRINN